MKEKENIKEEIRHEFLLERIILFSDAVFAIVITLMAIEIRIPELHDKISPDLLEDRLLHLVPVIIAYTASFAFIGVSWYHHLKIFSLVKNYDKGLIVRNLFLLFFIGLFPFGVSLVAQPGNGVMLPAIIYFIIILCCRISQMVMHSYVLYHPGIRLNIDIKDEILRFKKNRVVLILLFVMFVLVIGTTILVPNPDYKPVAWWWFFLFPFLLSFFKKRIAK